MRALVWALFASLALSPPAPVAAAPAAPPGEARSPACERGDRSTYRVEYRSEARTRFSRVLAGVGQGDAAVPALDGDYATAVRGAASFTVLDCSADGSVAAFQMEAPRVVTSSGGAPAVATAEAARRALASPTLVSLDRSGAIRSVWLDPTLDAAAQTLLRAVIAATQLVTPDAAEPRTARWEVEEEDPTGRYVARYEILGGETGSAARFRKTKLRYLPPPARADSGRQVLSPDVAVSGALTGRIDLRRRALRSLVGTEAQRHVLNGKEVARARTDLELVLVRRGPADAAALTTLDEARALLLRSSRSTPLFVVRSAEAIDAALAESQLGAATPDEVLAELAAADGATGEARRRARTRSYLRVKALAVARRDATARLAEVLAAAPAGSLAFEVIPLALAEAGTPEAQAALVSVLVRRGTDRAAVKAVVFALAGVAEITPSTVEALGTIAFGDDDPELAARAQLALGAQARALASLAPDRAGAIVSRLVSALDSAVGQRATRPLLLALGNSGLAAAFPAVRRRVDDPAPGIRSAAVSALRFQEGPEAERLLLRALEADPDESVRAAAATALAYREATPSAAEVQRRVLAGDGPDSVRVPVLQNLWSARERFPEAAEAVRRAASDASEAVREEATRLRAADAR